MRRILPLIVVLGMLYGCGGQPQKGSPNDPNEQQGNAKAKPENSITKKSNKEPGDNQAGRNVHDGGARANDNK